MPTPTDLAAAAVESRFRRRQQQIASGDLVPNKVFRDRVEFLQAHDPDFSLVIVCLRLSELGFPNYAKKPSGTTRTRKFTGDTSHLQRQLGMRAPAPTYKNGRRYEPPRWTSHVSYEFAVALCRALGMDPVDAGV